MFNFKGKKREVEIMKIGMFNAVIYKGVTIINATNDDKRVNWIMDAIDMLPEFVLHTITKRAILIRLDNKENCNHFKENPGVLGFYCVGTNVIYVKKDFKKRFISTILHEIGHFIDYNIQEGIFMTMKNEMKFFEAYKKEGHYVIKKYGEYYSSYTECFAQSFYAYITNDDNFQDRCPKLSNFVNSQILSLVA